MKMPLFMVLVVGLTASAAHAVPIAVPWFSDDFESYAGHIRLRAAAPNWVGGTGPENYIEAGTFPTPGGDKEVRLKGHSGTGATSNALTAYDWSAQSADNLQILQFTLQSDPTMGVGGGNHFYIYMDHSAGEIGRWYGHSGAVTPRVGGSVGPSVSLMDKAVHTFEINYDPATGVTNWLADGGLVWSLAQTTGLAVSDLEVVDQPNVQDWVWLDDVVVGTIPEPMTFSLLGLGSLLVLRRRR